MTEAAQPRAQGAVRLGIKKRDGRSVLASLHQRGSLKLLFPRGSGDALTGVLLNTAGGVTGGDRFSVAAEADAGCHLVLTTQAAERAYRAQPGETGRIDTRIVLGTGSRLDWLPQETLLYDGAALSRRLRVEMASDARALLVEPVILGRAAMGETVRDLAFHDRIEITCDGKLLMSDRTRILGDAVERMEGPATGAGCGAWASVVLAAPDAERLLAPARALMPVTGGVSLVRHGLLFARLLAQDGFTLRETMLPLIRLLNGGDLPRTWMI